MTDDEFLRYCHSHADTPRCGFVPEQIARLLRLAAPDECARDIERWEQTPPRVVNCDPEQICGLVEMARDRLATTPPA